MSGGKDNVGFESESASDRGEKYTAQATLDKHTENEEVEQFVGISRGIRLVKTVCFCCAGFAMGVPGSLLGPTMIELSELLNSTYEEIGWGSTALFIGALSGSLLGGVASDKFQPRADLLVHAGCLITGICVGLLPWTASLPVFYTCCLLGGLGSGISRTVVFALTNLMWEENSSTALHVVGAGATLGLMSSPLLATPFLSEKTSLSVSTGNTTTITSEEVKKPEEIRYVFGIIATVIVLTSLPFLVFYLRGSFYTVRKQGGISVKETFSPHTYSPDKPAFGVFFATMLFFMFAVVFAHASVMNLFLYVVSVDDYGVSEQLSSGLLVGIFLVEVFGKLAFGFISKCVKIQVIVFLQLFSILCFALGFITVAKRGEVYLWTLALIQQFFSGALYASYIPWGNRYVEFTGVITSLSQIATASGFAAGAGVIGPLYKTYNQDGLWYFLLVCCVSLILLTVPAQIAAAKVGERRFRKTLTSPAVKKIPNRLPNL